MIWPEPGLAASNSPRQRTRSRIQLQLLPSKTSLPMLDWILAQTTRSTNRRVNQSQRQLIHLARAERSACILSSLRLAVVACLCCVPALCAGESAPDPVIVAYVFPQDNLIRPG